MESTHETDERARDSMAYGSITSELDKWERDRSLAETDPFGNEQHSQSQSQSHSHSQHQSQSQSQQLHQQQQLGGRMGVGQSMTRNGAGAVGPTSSELDEGEDDSGSEYGHVLNGATMPLRAES